MNQVKLKFGHDFQPWEVEVLDLRNEYVNTEVICKVCGGHKLEHETESERSLPLRQIINNIKVACAKLEEDGGKYKSMKIV